MNNNGEIPNFSYTTKSYKNRIFTLPLKLEHRCHMIQACYKYRQLECQNFVSMSASWSLELTKSVVISAESTFSRTK